MNHFVVPIFVAAATILSTTQAHADHCGQLFKLLANDGDSGDRFGWSVAISGTTAIVGAQGDDDNGPGSGSAYLFDITTGQQLFKLLADDGADFDEFGLSVAINCTIAIVGAYNNDENGSNSGAAYLFNTTTGVQFAKLLPKDGALHDEFGASVAISGTTAIVGAINDDDNGGTSGSAYLIDTTSGQQLFKLLPNDGAEDDRFGNSVAISDLPGNEIAIVGVRWDDDNGSASGSAYLFSAMTGKQTAKLLPNDGAALDEFGASVAISGTLAFVGATNDDDNGETSGSAYLFDISDPANPKQVAKLIPYDGDVGDRFGFSVAISGTTAIVGAYNDGDNGTLSGSAYFFDISDPTNPRLIAKLLPSDGDPGDRFGWSVAISGTTAIIGARSSDDNGESTGSAYIFDAADFENCPWDIDCNDNIDTGDLLELFAQWGTNGPADFDGNGTVNTSDLLILFANWGVCE